MKMISWNNRKKNTRGVLTPFLSHFRILFFCLDLFLFSQTSLCCTSSCQVLLTRLKYPHFSSFIYLVNYLGWFFWGEKTLCARCSSFCAFMNNEDNEDLSEMLTAWSIWIIQPRDSGFDFYFSGCITGIQLAPTWWCYKIMINNN